MDNVLGLFTKGGIIMYPLLICSFLAIFIGAERMLFYKERKTDKLVVQKLLTQLAAKELEEAKATATASKGDCAELISFYLELKGDRKAKESVLETKAGILMDSYEERLSFLSSIITASPLLGLLGTIFGMISAFNVFNLRAGQPFAITGGIGEALIATAFGLSIAIIALLIFCFLKYKVNGLNKRLMQCCLALQATETAGE